MDNNNQIGKQQKIKQINQKLNLLLQKKGFTVQKSLTQKVIQKQKEKQKQRKIQQKQKAQNLIDEQQLKNIGKTKKIKKQQKANLEKQKKQSHNLRKAAGVVWQDKTMEQWPQNDYRIFVGNLGNEATDQVLSSVFRSKYQSFNMARVVRDRRTGKSRGYGFVSFSQPRDFLNSLKQMNGQYIGNRPAKIVKSNWKDRDLNSAQNQLLPSDFKTNSKKQTNKIFTDYKYVHPY